MKKYTLFWSLLLALALSARLASGGTILETNTVIFGGKTTVSNLDMGTNPTGFTGLAWNYWLSEPAPPTNTTGGTNVWILGYYAIPVTITNISSGASSGTGILDLGKLYDGSIQLCLYYVH